RVYRMYRIFRQGMGSKFIRCLLSVVPLVPKLCLGTGGREALLRRTGSRAGMSLPARFAVPAKQSFATLRSQAELGNEEWAPPPPVLATDHGPRTAIATASVLPDNHAAPYRRRRAMSNTSPIDDRSLLLTLEESSRLVSHSHDPHETL